MYMHNAIMLVLLPNKSNTINKWYWIKNRHDNTTSDSIGKHTFFFFFLGVCVCVCYTHEIISLKINISISGAIWSNQDSLLWQVKNTVLYNTFKMNNLAGLGFFRKKPISSGTPGKKWKKPISSSFVRTKLEETGQNWKKLKDVRNAGKK